MSAIVRRPPPRVTLEDFLAWPGDGTAKRYQLVDGEIRGMSPASDAHGTIQSNLAYLVIAKLRASKSRCRGRVDAAVVPRIGSHNNLRVPDYAVTCAANKPGEVIIPEPVLLVEILSPGNESDTRENVWAYTTVPSVREILVVHSTKITAEVLRRGTDGCWPKSPETVGPDGTLRLDSVDLECALTELYAGTHLA